MIDTTKYSIDAIKARLDAEPMLFTKLPEEYRNNVDLLRLVVTSCPQLIHHSKAILEYTEYAQIVKKKGDLIKYVPENLQDSKLIELAVESNGFKAYINAKNQDIPLTAEQVAYLYLKTDTPYKMFINYQIRNETNAFKTASPETIDKIKKICEIITEKNSGLATIISLGLSTLETEIAVRNLMSQPTSNYQVEMPSL